MYLLSGAMSLHHLAIMTKPSLSCLLCFLCMLAIPIFPFLKFKEFLIYLYICTLFLNTNVHVFHCKSLTSVMNEEMVIPMRVAGNAFASELGGHSVPPRRSSPCAPCALQTWEDGGSPEKGQVQHALYALSC